MTRIDCLPWWHDKFAHLSTGHSRPKIRSGCRLSGGNITCDPERMRAKAEAEMNRLGYGGHFSLAAYTLARYVSSEVGSGSPEEKVAVMEAAINRARGTPTSPGWYKNGSVGDGVNQLLLYHPKARSTSHPNYGYYGPIHGSTGDAPYQRWAATSSDPGIDDLLIARFVLSGGSNNFARYAVTQYGPDVRTSHHGYEWAKKGVARKARESDYYWVGPLPGVDHWHTFLYKVDKSIGHDSPLGKQLIAQAEAALTEPKQRATWEGYPVCKRSIFARVPAPVYALAGVGAAFGIWYWLSRTRRVPERYTLPFFDADAELELAPPAPGHGTTKFDPWSAEERKKRLATEFMAIRSKKIKGFVPRELPEHIYPFAEYMRRAADKEVTPREVAKAYILTVGSMRRAAINVKKVRAKWRGYKGPKTGMVRPEDVLGELLKSPVGQRYLDAAEQGRFDARAARTLSKRFGVWGFEPTFHKQLKTAVTLADDASTIDRLLKRGRRSTWYNYVTNRVSGVSMAKAGFFASLMGRGDIATADARELDFWLCEPDEWHIPKGKCDRPFAAKFEASRFVDEDFMDIFNKKMSGLKMKMPAKYKPFSLHLTHHALWDKVGKSKTTHAEIIDAMEKA